MCGIAGVWFPKEVESTGIDLVEILTSMTAAQQHRGQEGVGIITTQHGNNNEFCRHKGFGLVYDVLTKLISNSNCHCGITHNRYSTTGLPARGNIQPFFSINDEGEQIGVSHNGNLTSILKGMRPSSSDTWSILNSFVAVNSDQEIHRRIYQALKNIKGAFSLIFLHQDKDGKNSLICVRDPQGIRPLWLAKYNFTTGEKSKVGYLAASETRAFDKINKAQLWRPVKPGEIVVINDDGVKSFRPKAWRDQPIANCIFELIYFMHPGSIIETPNFNKNPIYAYKVQRALGGQLAKENPKLLSDFITMVPDSSREHTIGMSVASKIPTESLILRNHYVGRTFITPTGKASDDGNDQDERDKKILRKFSFLFQILEDVLSFIICDDSIVRGKTQRGIVKELRREISNRDKQKPPKIVIAIASPPVKYPCFMGVDMSTKKELAWHKYGDIVGIRKAIHADKLFYLTINGMLDAVKKTTGCKDDKWCAACFNGYYPVEIEREEYRKEIEN